MPDNAQTSAMDPMEQTIAATLAVANPTPADAPPIDATPVTPTGERPRDASGRFTPQTQAETDAAVLAQGDTPAEPEAVEDVAPVIPEGYVAAVPLPDDRAKAFKVFDAEGEILPPDLTFELVANGKPRKLTTDKLVSFAQMGVYNHEREVQMQETQATSRQVEQRATQAEQLAQQYAEDRRRLLSDADYLTRAITDFESQNTPEARAAAERQQFENERQTFEQQRVAQQAEQFVDGQLAPALEQIATTLPEVSREELAARLFVFADRHRVDGVLHPKGFEAVSRYIVDELVPWAQQVHAAREIDRVTPITAARNEAKKEVETAQVRAQKARRTATTVLKPVTRVTPQSAPQKPVRTAQDAEEAVVGNTLSRMRTG